MGPMEWHCAGLAGAGAPGSTAATSYAAPVPAQHSAGTTPQTTTRRRAALKQQVGCCQHDTGQHSLRRPNC